MTTTVLEPVSAHRRKIGHDGVAAVVTVKLLPLVTTPPAVTTVIGPEIAPPDNDGSGGGRKSRLALTAAVLTPVKNTDALDKFVPASVTTEPGAPLPGEAGKRRRSGGRHDEFVPLTQCRRA